MVPLCEPHLELSRRYGYRVPRGSCPPGRSSSGLLVTYAVDPLRELVGGTGESIPGPDDERDDQLYPGVRARLLRLSELDVVCATGASELCEPRLEPLPFGDVADTSVVACSNGPSLAMS